MNSSPRKMPLRRTARTASSITRTSSTTVEALWEALKRPASKLRLRCFHRCQKVWLSTWQLSDAKNCALRKQSKVHPLRAAPTSVTSSSTPISSFKRRLTKAPPTWPMPASKSWTARRRRRNIKRLIYNVSKLARTKRFLGSKTSQEWCRRHNPTWCKEVTVQRHRKLQR